MKIRESHYIGEFNYFSTQIIDIPNAKKAREVMQRRFDKLCMISKPGTKAFESNTVCKAINHDANIVHRLELIDDTYDDESMYFESQNVSDQIKTLKAKAEYVGSRTTPTYKNVCFEPNTSDFLKTDYANTHTNDERIKESKQRGLYDPKEPLVTIIDNLPISCTEEDYSIFIMTHAIEIERAERDKRNQEMIDANNTQHVLQD